MMDIKSLQDDIDEMFERMDDNGDLRISFDEYASLMLELDHTRSASALRIGFERIDTDRDGWASPKEFRAWCQ